MSTGTKGHGVVMQDCRTLSLSGVTDADRFDENRIKVFTECGELCVCGSELHVNEMNVTTGNMVIEGVIEALIYGDRRFTKKPGLLRRLLK